MEFFLNKNGVYIAHILQSIKFPLILQVTQASFSEKQRNSPTKTCRFSSQTKKARAETFLCERAIIPMGCEDVKSTNG